LINSLQGLDVDTFRGKSIVVIGSMNSAKTYEIFTLEQELRFSEYNMKIFQPSFNDRDLTQEEIDSGLGKILSSTKINDEFASLEAFVFPYDNPESIFEIIDREDESIAIGCGDQNSYLDIIVIEEFPFIPHNKFTKLMKDLPNYEGKPRIVIGTGLDKDYRGKMFENTKHMLAQGCNIVKKQARCRALLQNGKLCSKPTTHTMRLICPNNEYGYKNGEFKFKDKFDNPVPEYAPAPWWDETYIVEDSSTKKDTEIGQRRIYTAVCENHHFVPGKKEVEKVYNFVTGNDHPNRVVSLDEIKSKFKNLPYLDYILHFLTKEGDLMLQKGNLKARPLYRDPITGHVLDHSEFGDPDPETIYTPVKEKQEVR
jgi:thymidine kinase